MTTNWKHLNGDTDSCSHPRCRQGMRIILSEDHPNTGGKRLQLCDDHYERFSSEVPPNRGVRAWDLDHPANEEVQA